MPLRGCKRKLRFVSFVDHGAWLSATLLLVNHLAKPAEAAIWIDSERRARLQTSVEPSSASGHALVRFAISPVDSTAEISSIDAGSGEYGFYGMEFRQVEVFGLPTVFAD